MSTTSALYELVYDDTDDPAEAFRRIDAAREHGPIAMGTHGPELLTYELVRAVMRDDRFTVPQGFGLPAQGITSGPLWDRAASSMLCVEGEQHRRLRKLVARTFTPKAAERMRDTCTRVVNELIDAHAAAGHCNIVEDIARPYPVPVICEALGAPARDCQQFSAWANDVLRLFGWNVADNAEAILTAWAELDDYVDAMVDERLGSLTDDLLSDLIRAEVDGDRLSHEDLRMLAGGLLMAGTDTTRNQLAAAVEDLCEHPGQWELLAEHPELARSAVEELVRHRPIALATLRIALTDVELAGVPIPAGTLVLANAAAANRDPAVFTDPDRLDITRSEAAPLTFGGGMHYCLGVHLAKLELTEALSTLTQRIRDPRTVGPSSWKPFGGISGPVALPIEYRAA